MDVNHVIAAVVIRERQALYASQDWQRRAVMEAALRRMRRRPESRPKRFRLWRPLVVRPEGGMG